MPADDDLIEAAPCPNCRSPLTVSVADLGHLVECPGCGTQFRARRPGSTSPPPPPRREERRDDRRDDRDDSEPRRRRFEDDEDRDARPRRSSGRAWDDEPERGRGSRYDRDYDDDRYEDRRRRGRPGVLTALAVMHFIYAGLLLLCGVLGTIFLAMGAEFIRGAGGQEPNWAMEIFQMFCTFGTGLLALFAGVQALQSRGYGVSVAALVFGGITAIVWMVDVVLNAENDQGPDREVGMVCGVMFVAVFWMGYLVTNGILLAKSGRHFR